MAGWLGICGGVLLTLAAEVAGNCGVQESAVPYADPIALDPQRNALNTAAEPVRNSEATAKASATWWTSPLSAMPVSELSATRERPLFSPSRRPPPPPVAVATPPPTKLPSPAPRQLDHPLLTLIGTVVGESKHVGVFLEEASKNVIRLQPGQDHGGWTLRWVGGREVEFEKDGLTAALVLPAQQSPQRDVPAALDTAPILAAHHRKR